MIIHVAAEDRDPETAQRIANSVGKVLPALVDQLEQPSNGGPSPVKVSVVQTADLPTTPTSPRPKAEPRARPAGGPRAGRRRCGRPRDARQLGTPTEQAEELAGAPVLGAINFDPDAPKNPLVVVTQPHVDPG